MTVEEPHWTFMKRRLTMQDASLTDIEEGCVVNIPAGSIVEVYAGPPNNNLMYNLKYNGYLFRDTMSQGAWTRLP